MTIFPTHKTKLKTKLPRHEVLNRLVHNDFYVWGFDYKLDKIKYDYFLKPVRQELGPRNSGVPVIKINLTPQTDGTKLNLSFRPITAVSIIFLIWLTMAFAMQIAFIATTIGEVGFSLVHLLPTLMGLVAYLVGLIIFSVEVISIRKQIEEALEAEIHEVTDGEKSKLQKWYEKKR